jgi:ribosomal protein S27AE
MPSPDPVPDRDARWRDLAEGVLTGFRAWREAHPRATLAEIERALDERWAATRARLLEDAAAMSRAADLAGSAERPPCPHCGTPLRADGAAVRRLTTTGDQVLRLRRSRARCPACGAGLFPPR